MAQVINTNSLSLITQNNINKNQSALSTSIERLSSGLRINSAKDDAAGQAIANRFQSNITGLTQAARNANDGISAAQTTEGALSEINNNLQRVRELTVQSQNGTNSQSDLDSIQDEIKSRLDEIDRVSGQTQFNGVNVLSKDGTLKIQVGANDGETINIDLKKIDSSTLGLNGFNVNGTGTIANKAATISDLAATGADVSNSSAITVTTKFDALDAKTAFGKLNDGDTVSIGAQSYSYDATNKNFTTNTVVATGTDTQNLGDSLKAAAGQTQSGTYTSTSGKVNFDVDASGNITIGGQAAYIVSGALTTNNPTGSATAATMKGLFGAADTNNNAGAAIASSVDFGGKTYSFDGGAGAPVVGGGVSYKDSISSDALLAKVNADATADDVKIKFNNGPLTFTASFKSGVSSATASNPAYVDSDGALTTTASYDTKYSVDKDTGAVSVTGGTGTGKYAANVGSQAYVSASGKLTTETTSAGTVTSDPLAALDSAISSIDKFRSSLGAIQNRLDSAVTNLNNTTTNLSEAQSRIQDADYATEVSNMSKAQIIQQAGNSVLAKANQVPQQVLSLLQG
ncbi:MULTISPECIES: FliC/FljB family flagellin [unclassified Pantoea]|uniref:FliC/FljB family flagellin n=1 Tax=unclassified Pantoea TaxID=2630326 RepID=UPI001CD43872|nr:MULTISPECIES: FliC/FljB family flagellin [unclassified Pantoea]MCA1176396.1 FliC/FljB family flagellin [Pantoea sp. alder69]MCA1249366.1 FliC/FljB family flagellin [Pantoea sp. alder70]MCA1264559.1 FliC/FljB family flagellin [Pantoea sp. alder81]